MKRIYTMLNDRFGSYRGLIRLSLDRVKYRLGLYAHYQQVEWHRVQRLVFVCQGNICRSPYAHQLALGYTNRVASLGYATTTGAPANDTAQEVAASRGISLSGHRATDINDFIIREGDLFLVMEDRHLARMAPYLKNHPVQMSMLGFYAAPRYPLLYDPHHLSPAYFNHCYQRIESAVAHVAARFNARHKIDKGLAP